MKLQLCTFTRSKDSEIEVGVAKLRCFGVSDVDWIMDDMGNIIHSHEVFDYELKSAMAYAAIDTDVIPAAPKRSISAGIFDGSTSMDGSTFVSADNGLWSTG